jgi:hypothetical protein
MQINMEMVHSKTNKDNSDVRHQQHKKMIKGYSDNRTITTKRIRMFLTEYGLVTKVSITRCLGEIRRNYFRNTHSVLQESFLKNSGKRKNMRTST